MDVDKEVLQLGECITIHVGQAGIQMGNSVWELLCLEHGVKQNGSVHVREAADSRCSITTSAGSIASRSIGSTNTASERQGLNTGVMGRLDMLTGNKSSQTARVKSRSSRESVVDSMGLLHSPHPVETIRGALFEELRRGKVTPRALVIDTDCTTINELLDGPSKLLHQRERLISGDMDTAGIFSKGYLANETLLQDACTQISKMAAKCDNLRSFLVFRSCGGGTGSGLASALMLRLADEYGDKKSILEINVGPTRKANRMMSPSVTEPYNAVLSTHKSMCCSECVFTVDNNATYDICADQLDIEAPQYINLNRLIAQVVSSLTSSMRYHDEHNVYPDDLQKHTMPFPRLKFPLASFAPLGTKSAVEREGPLTVTQLTKMAFQPRNHLMEFDPHVGNYLGCALLYRGDIPLADVTAAVERVTQLRRFADRCEPDFVIGITAQPAPLVPFGDMGRCPRSAVLVSNTTSVKRSWSRVVQDFDVMLRHRAYMHWYLRDGMDRDEFVEAKEDLVALVREYDEVDALVADKIGGEVTTTTVDEESRAM